MLPPRMSWIVYALAHFSAVSVGDSADRFAYSVKFIPLNQCVAAVEHRPANWPGAD